MSRTQFFSFHLEQVEVVVAERQSGQNRGVVVGPPQAIHSIEVGKCGFRLIFGRKSHKRSAKTKGWMIVAPGFDVVSAIIAGYQRKFRGQRDINDFSMKMDISWILITISLNAFKDIQLLLSPRMLKGFKFQLVHLDKPPSQCSAVCRGNALVVLHAAPLVECVRR